MTEYENTLRALIINLLGESDSTEYKVSDERITKWKEKREIEKKKNKGILLEKRLFFYSDFYDLRTIIEKNWEVFKPVLEDKKRFLVFFKEIEHFRNTLAHGRTLILSQEKLLSGILMDLKNSITIHNNRTKMKDDFFVEIIKISDNPGNSWEKSIFKRSKPPILKIGDEYELKIEANDPKDRNIQYQLHVFTTDINLIQDHNRFNFKISEEFIGRNTILLVTVSTPDLNYKNESTRKIYLTVYPN